MGSVALSRDAPLQFDSSMTGLFERFPSAFAAGTRQGDRVRHGQCLFLVLGGGERGRRPGTNVIANDWEID
jgi:hypothetical protein